MARNTITGADENLEENAETLEAQAENIESDTVAPAPEATAEATEDEVTEEATEGEVEAELSEDDVLLNDLSEALAARERGDNAPSEETEAITENRSTTSNQGKVKKAGKILSIALGVGFGIAAIIGIVERHTINEANRNLDESVTAANNNVAAATRLVEGVRPMGRKASEYSNLIADIDKAYSDMLVEMYGGTEQKAEDETQLEQEAKMTSVAVHNENGEVVQESINTEEYCQKAKDDFFNLKAAGAINDTNKKGFEYNSERLKNYKKQFWVIDAVKTDGAMKTSQEAISRNLNTIIEKSNEIHNLEKAELIDEIEDLNNQVYDVAIDASQLSKKQVKMFVGDRIGRVEEVKCSYNKANGEVKIVADCFDEIKASSFKTVITATITADLSKEQASQAEIFSRLSEKDVQNLVIEDYDSAYSRYAVDEQGTDVAISIESIYQGGKIDTTVVTAKAAVVSTDVKGNLVVTKYSVSTKVEGKEVSDEVVDNLVDELYSQLNIEDESERQ